MTVKEKSQKQLDNELRESIKIRLAEGFENTDEEMVIDNGSSLIIRVNDINVDVEVKIIVKKNQFDIEIAEEEPEEEPEETTEEPEEEPEE